MTRPARPPAGPPTRPRPSRAPAPASPARADIRRRLLERKADLVHNTRLALVVRGWDCVEARLLGDKHKMAALRCGAGFGRQHGFRFRAQGLRFRGVCCVRRAALRCGAGFGQRG